MFIVTLTYKVPAERVEPHREAHMKWVRDAFSAGLFIASGAKVPRTGGVLLSRADRGELEEALANDPFAIHNVADYDVVEFTPTTTAPGYEILRADAP